MKKEFPMETDEYSYFFKYLTSWSQDQIWADQTTQNLIIKSKHITFAKIPYSDIWQAFNQPYLSHDKRAIHYSTPGSSGVKARFECRCKYYKCPVHNRYYFPLHEECDGDGCEDCGNKGYLYIPYLGATARKADEW